MIFTVSSAAAALRSTQNTCAPSRAKVTAVALPLPQPGPIEPAPTTIAVLPLSRCIEFPPFIICLVEATCSPDGALAKSGVLCCGFPGFASATSGLRIIRCAHRRNIHADRMPKELRQRPAIAARAQPPLAGGPGIAEQHFRH